MNGRPRLLLLCPRFFSYHEGIMDAARRQGIEADWLDDRGGFSWPYKVGLKVLPGLIRTLTQQPILHALEGLSAPSEIDHVLVVKGDGLARSTVERIRTLAPNATMTIYLWDNVRNIRGGVKHLVGAFDRVISFDPADAAAHNWEFLPNFCRTPISPPDIARDYDYDWSFVGSLHSDRHRVLRGLIRLNPEARFRVHCYSQNRLAGLLRSYRDPLVILSRRPPITHEIMPLAEAWRISQRSRAVLDIEHPMQNGLTMRTLETLLDGRKLVTTNGRLRSYDLYDPSRVAIIDRNEPVIDANFFATPFKPLQPRVAEKYLAENWLQYVLGLKPNPHEPPACAAPRPV